MKTMQTYVDKVRDGILTATTADSSELKQQPYMCVCVCVLLLSWALYSFRGQIRLVGKTIAKSESETGK